MIVRDCPRHGILGGDVGSGSLTLEHSEVFNCGGGDRDHQIYMSTDQVNRPGSVFRMRHCFVHDAKGGNNVKSRSERNEIHYNWIEGAYYHELELIGPDPFGVADGFTARMKREDSEVLGNVFWKRRTAAGNDSNFAVFRVGGDATGETHGRYRFVNNTVIPGTGAVFRCFDSLESVEMHNNVFHRPGGGVNMTRVAEAVTLLGPAGLAFPNPLFPPAFGPPVRSLSGSPLARPIRGGLDIGAFEEGTTVGTGPTQGRHRDRSPPWAGLPGKGQVGALFFSWEKGNHPSLWSVLGREAGSVAVAK